MVASLQHIASSLSSLHVQSAAALQETLKWFAKSLLWCAKSDSDYTTRQHRINMFLGGLGGGKDAKEYLRPAA